ncbi:MAG: type I restriction-modification enzyme R subunit C-terminal domain-containing protein [Bacteroidota bacterium]
MSTLPAGVNVPSICNLVFMRRVRSRILYSQILGRATRRCDEIDKEYFRIFDAVRLYEALEDYTEMKPVSVNPKASFAQLAEELKLIEGEERLQQQIDQLLAKFQQKKRYIGDQNDPTFRYLTDDRDPEAFVELLKAGSPREIAQQLQNFHSLWPFLDKLKPLNHAILVSEHEDRLLRVERGYGQGQKPEDYLESFEQFIRENQNKIQALQIICTRPKELNRQSLRELKIELDQQGFTTQALQAAWKQVRNQDIAADIIGYIRTLAIGTSLLSHEERIKKAMDKIRASKEWNATQRKWLDRFESQLLQETVLQKENLDEGIFAERGGFARLNKIFNEELGQLLDQLNEHLYEEPA